MHARFPGRHPSSSRRVPITRRPHVGPVDTSAKSRCMRRAAIRLLPASGPSYRLFSRLWRSAPSDRPRCPRPFFGAGVSAAHLSRSPDQLHPFPVVVGLLRGSSHSAARLSQHLAMSSWLPHRLLFGNPANTSSQKHLRPTGSSARSELGDRGPATVIPSTRESRRRTRASAGRALQKRPGCRGMRPTRSASTS